MPAETHRHGEPVDTEMVVELIWALTTGGSDEADASTVLGAVDADDDLARLRLWTEATEELAERAAAEPDLSLLFGATTIGELAEVIVASLRLGDQPDLGTPTASGPGGN